MKLADVQIICVLGISVKVWEQVWERRLLRADPGSRMAGGQFPIHSRQALPLFLFLLLVRFAPGPQFGTVRAQMFGLGDCEPAGLCIFQWPADTQPAGFRGRLAGVGYPGPQWVPVWGQVDQRVHGMIGDHWPVMAFSGAEKGGSRQQVLISASAPILQGSEGIAGAGSR